MCHIENETLKDVEWFVKFCSGDLALKYVQRSGRPSEVDDIHIKVIIDSDRHSTTRDIAEKLIVSHTWIKKDLSPYQ